MTTKRRPAVAERLLLELTAPVAHSSRTERTLMSLMTHPRRLAVLELPLFSMNPPMLKTFAVEVS